MLRLPTILLAVSVSVQAVDDDGNKWPEQCHPAQTQMDLNLCADSEFRARDAELNRAYKAAMQGLAPEQQEQLRKEQRAWLKSRDPDCLAHAEAEAAGGSMRPMLYSLCRAEATERRTRQLREWAP